MANIIDCFKEAINENHAWVKLVVYSVPIYLVLQLYYAGKTVGVSVAAIVCALYYLGLVTKGINNVRMNKSSVLSLNPLEVVWALAKSMIVLIPQGLVLGVVGHFLVMFLTSIPVQFEQYNLAVAIVVWSIIGSILLTSFMSFAKYLRITDGYNLAIIGESCVDVFLSVFFCILLTAIVDLIVFWPLYYLFHDYMHLPLGHPFMIAVTSIAIMINFSMFVNYLAQSSYEQIKGNNEDYDDNYNKIDVVDDAAARMNGH